MEQNTKKVSTVTESKKVSYELPQLIDLLQAGAHFGHKKSAWNPRMKQYIYEERNGIHIIDLVKTMSKLDDALKALGTYANSGNILIVGTKGQAATIVQDVATRCGMFYVNTRWPGGLFTNFDEIKRSTQKLIKMEEKLAGGAEGLVKKEVLLMERDIERQNKVYSGVKFMDKLPTAIIVIDSQVEKNAIKEARKAHIPVIGLIDTNCNPDLIDYPIPANDDSIKSIKLFVELMGQVVAQSRASLSVISLRKNYIANLVELQKNYQIEKERREKMDAEDKERMKSLKDGVVESNDSASVVRVVKKEKNIDAEMKEAEKIMREAKDKLVEDLGLSARIVKSLHESNVKTITDLKKYSAQGFESMKGIGAKAAEEIAKKLKDN
ncbi:30S ribosomal protein S2 [bacterium]|nr:30S ribosomal protein S2 [bacterium]